MKRFRAQLAIAARYYASSLTSFALELLILYALLGVLPHYWAVPTAFLASTLALYIGCHLWVFSRSGRTIPVEYTYFFTIMLSGLAWASILTPIIVETWGVHVLVARIISSIFTGVWDFYLNARFNFRSHAFLRPGRK